MHRILHRQITDDLWSLM